MSKGLAGIMKQAQMIQQKMAKLQEESALKEASATAGGGAVAVVVNGKNEIKSLTIKPEAVDPNDVEMLQDLIIAAVNEAMKTVHAEMSGEMSKITGGLNIPGLF
jgi:DNA-binding YbaB/EbfC family protein